MPVDIYSPQEVKIARIPTKSLSFSLILNTSSEIEGLQELTKTYGLEILLNSFDESLLLLWPLIPLNKKQKYFNKAYHDHDWKQFQLIISQLTPNELYEAIRKLGAIDYHKLWSLFPKKNHVSLFLATYMGHEHSLFEYNLVRMDGEELEAAYLFGSI